MHNSNEMGTIAAPKIEATNRSQFDGLSGYGLLQFAKHFAANYSAYAEAYTSEPVDSATLSFNEWSVHIYKTYPRRISYFRSKMLLESNPKVAAEKLLCDFVEWEIEDSAADPRAGCDPILISAVIKDDCGRRDLTEEELAAIEEHCADALNEMLVEGNSTCTGWANPV